jgi:protein-S-isoprenylcysteine O-methyltransferase Ste14
MKLRTRNYFFNYRTLILVSIFLFFFLRFYLATDKPVNIFSYIGFLLLVPSILLFTISRIQLGGSFQFSAEANHLVKTGIYKKVLHPVYLFGLIFLSGIIFITQTFFLIIIWVIVSGFQLKRIHQEEKVLTEKFGDEYIENKKRTWF